VVGYFVPVDLPFWIALALVSRLSLLLFGDFCFGRERVWRRKGAGWGWRVVWSEKSGDSKKGEVGE
jgi:hypothetical protein